MGASHGKATPEARTAVELNTVLLEKGVRGAFRLSSAEQTFAAVENPLLFVGQYRKKVFATLRSNEGAARKDMASGGIAALIGEPSGAAGSAYRWLVRLGDEVLYGPVRSQGLPTGALQFLERATEINPRVELVASYMR